MSQKITDFSVAQKKAKQSAFSFRVIDADAGPSAACMPRPVSHGGGRGL